ncbi:MAG: DegV family protein [Ktedonobacteraceae bacterium]|nr:DegV family protein [Ktedonobacteraceae bacterium]
MAVRIVTDSTADIPLAQAQALAITIVPLTVFFGEQAFLDGVELDNAGFYRKLRESKSLPRTSQPPPAAFQEAYKNLISEGADGILSVHLSSKLSGTYQSACTARDTLPESMKKVPIAILDSCSISVGMSQPIMHVAQGAKQGLSLEEIKVHVINELSRTHVLAVLDTLEFLKRGGRIGSARAMLGNMLNVKPILALKDGEAIPLERPRTRSKAYARIAQLVSEMGKIESLCIAEASEEVGQQLAQAIREVYKGDIPFYKLGAVLGTHTGPGTAAVAVITAQ